VVVVTILGIVFGDNVRLLAISAIALVGLVATILIARRKARIAEALSRESPDAQADVLVLLENLAIRPDLARPLGRPAPRVPLRRCEEIFRYSEQAVRTSRWTMTGCIVIAGLAAAGAMADLLFGTEHFFAQGVPWWEPAGLIAFFGGAALFMRWTLRIGRARIHITDDAITLAMVDGSLRRIDWSSVVEVRRSDLARSLTIRSQRDRIIIWDTLDDFGRVVNLVATRMPNDAPWRAS
jgi:hypothetical protein